MKVEGVGRSMSSSPTCSDRENVVMTDVIETVPVSSTTPPVDPRRERADGIIRSHTIWAMGAGLMPLPLLDLAAVTAVQMDLVRSLAGVYSVNYAHSQGKTFVSALAGGAIARIGASLVKSVPGVGSLVGGASMSVLSAASTYGVGQVLVAHFERGGTFDTIDFSWATDAYRSAYDKGRAWVDNLSKKSDPTPAHSVFESIEKLRQLKEQGVVTEEEFNVMKERLLSQL